MTTHPCLALLSTFTNLSLTADDGILLAMNWPLRPQVHTGCFLALVESGAGGAQRNQVGLSASSHLGLPRRNRRTWPLQS